MQAKDVMTDGILSVKSDATVLEAAALLVNMRVGAMPVLDEQGTMLGIVTEADLLPYAALEPVGEDAAADGAVVTAKLLQSRHVTDVMTRDVITIADTAPLNDVVTMMVEKRLKHLPVHRDNAVVGIVSRIDLLRVIAAHAGGLDTRPLAVEDKDLRGRVMAALRGRSWSNAVNLDVAVEKGEVHLWGIIGSEEDHMAYRKAAESVPGVKRVISHIHVKPVAAKAPAGDGSAS